MARELARNCTSCDNKWFAVRVAWSPRPGLILNSRNIGYKYRREEYDKFSHCPRCNSTKIKTVTGKARKEFVPTGAAG